MEKIKVIPLGTVSPYPKDNMNCPGFLVEYNNSKILIDCGNGITSLLRFPNDLNNLNVIITHYHKDHFSDIGSIQYASYVYHNLGLLKKKVNVFLPKKDFCYNKKSILENNESYCNYIDIENGLTLNINNLNVTLEDNFSHTIESFMVKLKSKNFKIVYTSDIGVSNFDKLIQFCKDSDLLICESSFLKRYDLESTTHMTAYDAGRLANLANVKKLLLTHFWPEENKQEYLKEAKLNFKKVDVATEGKVLRLKK